MQDSRSVLEIYSLARYGTYTIDIPITHCTSELAISNRDIADGLQ
jgi:hypothetical protein